MSTPQEKILLVEGDPEISDLIAHQALQPLGYRVKVIPEASKAIQEAVRLDPDVMIVNLNLPGLSGKDLLVALSSQGVDMPIIVIAEQGMEGDVIQAFRLGASDYLGWPIREAEVVSAVERALTQVRAQREREKLAKQVKSTNRELQNRIRELTTILSIGKAVTSIKDRGKLFDKIIEGAVYVAQADKGWLLLREGDDKTFSLSAYRNLPNAIAAKKGQTWDDGISSLVALSGESLSIHGAPIKRFKVSRLGQSALVVPVKAQAEVLGLLTVVREAAKPFDPGNQKLLEALADYASISLVNVSLFQALEERARYLQKVAEESHDSELFKANILRSVNREIQAPLVIMSQEIELLTERKGRPLNKQQVESIQTIKDEIRKATRVVDALSLLAKAHSPQNLVSVNFVDIARQAVQRFKTPARENRVSLMLELPEDPVYISADTDQIGQVFDALLSNAVRVSPRGEVIVRVDRDANGTPRGLVQDSGPGIEEEHLVEIFQPFYKLESSAENNYDGLGIGLALAAEIVRSHGGDLTVKSRPQRGSTFYFTLPKPK